VSEEQPCCPFLGRKALPAVCCFVAIGGTLSTTWSSGAQSLAPCGEAPARAFDFWVGDWNIRQQILREDGTYVELPAKTSVSVVLDGCALIEYWEGKVEFFWERMEKPELMKAISIRAYEPRTMKWYIHWMDTRSRHFDTPYVGDFTDGRGEFYREWTTPEGTRIGRIAFSNVPPDSVSWNLAVSSDERKSWTTMWMMEMRRAGK
jgi:hypothetical protein